MKVTKELLAAHRGAAKGDAKESHRRVVLVPNPGEGEVSAFATDGHFAVAITREYNPDTEEPPFGVAFDGEHARAVLEAAKGLKLDLVDLTRAPSGEAPRVTADFYDPKKGRSLADHSFPATHEEDKRAAVMSEAVVGKPRASVALDSKLLAELAKVRSQVGGHGVIMLEVRGPTDPVVARWSDASGHKGKCLVAPKHVEDDVWTSAIW